MSIEEKVKQLDERLSSGIHRIVVAEKTLQRLWFDYEQGRLSFKPDTFGNRRIFYRPQEKPLVECKLAERFDGLTELDRFVEQALDVALEKLS